MKRFYPIHIISYHVSSHLPLLLKGRGHNPSSKYFSYPEPYSPAPKQYILTVTAGEGGKVSTEGGTYDEGTSITITATPNEGYEFVGWVGSDSTDNSLPINSEQ